MNNLAAPQQYRLTQQTHVYEPFSFISRSSLVNGLSVPFCRVTCTKVTNEPVSQAAMR
jgi:hypothetical protein